MRKLFYILAIFCGALFFSQNINAQTSTDSVRTTVIKVGNLTCNGDMPTIKKQLLNQDGIDEVIFTPRADNMSTFTIKYHSSITNRKGIEKVIETTPGCDDKNATPYRVKKEKDKE